MESLLTKLPWRVKFGSFLLCILGGKKKRLHLLLVGRTAGPQRPGILPFDGKSSPVTQDFSASYRWLSAMVLLWEIKNIFPPAQVDGVRFFLTDEGIQMVVIDGHHGKVVDRVTFRNSILQGIPAQIENYVNNIKDQWVNNLLSLRCSVQ